MLYSLISCRTLPQEAYNSIIEDGLYTGYESGLLGRFNKYVIIKGDTAYTEEISERSSNIMINDNAYDTLFRKDDSTFIGRKFSLNLRSNILLLESKDQPEKKRSQIKLTRADKKERSLWNIRHNRLQLFQLEAKYRDRQHKIISEEERRKFTDAYTQLQKMTDMEQDEYLNTIEKFEKQYLESR